MKRFKGFTLIELVMVIVILGILAAVAIPRFVDLTTSAKEAAEKGVVGGVRAGIYTYYAENRAFPGSMPDCAVGGNCFTGILSSPVTEDWSCAANVCTGPAGGVYTYDPSDGSFE
jgi:MSHA pilin protein MshA